MSAIATRRTAQSGIALVLALWLTVLLTVLASGFAFSMRSEALAARNAVSLAQARAVADGAVERTAYELMRPRVADAWTFDGREHRWNEGDAAIAVTAVDEASKIDLNAAPDALLKSMLTTIGGMQAAAAAALVDAIGDWRDTDDLRRPSGAEASEYRAANLKYVPANAPFETIGEAARVLGMTPAVFRRIAPAITVYSRQPGINAATADVLVCSTGLIGIPLPMPALEAGIPKLCGTFGSGGGGGDAAQAMLTTDTVRKERARVEVEGDPDVIEATAAEDDLD
jgi:general secretion pathway protein K